MEHINITITGRVQGVWFRKYTHSKANQLGLHGYVKNRYDGSVYAEAEGDKATLDKFIAWCHVGSPLSDVKEVKWESGEVVGYKGFEVR